MITGTLILDGWHGITRQTVEVVGATPKRYRIQAIKRTKLAGPSRWLDPGKTALVPKHALRDNCEICHGIKGGVPGNENIIDGKRVCDYCHAERQ